MDGIATPNDAGGPDILFGLDFRPCRRVRLAARFRTNGTFLQATAFAKQTWAEKVDSKGKPIRIPGKEPTREGVLVFPDVGGAANWWSPTYSPKTNLFYLKSFDGGAKYYLTENPKRAAGQQFLGGIGESNEYEAFPNPSYISAVRALDPTTGERKWQYVVETKSTSGLLSTAGNLIFGGSKQGNFYALQAKTGTELWRLDIGGNVHAAPISYLAQGKQQVTIAAGSALFTFGL